MIRAQISDDNVRYTDERTAEKRDCVCLVWDGKNILCGLEKVTGFLVLSSSLPYGFCIARAAHQSEIILQSPLKHSRKANATGSLSLNKPPRSFISPIAP